MFARQVVLLVVSILGIFGIVPALFMMFIGLAEQAEKSRAWAELALVICAAFLIWEFVELWLAKRSGRSFFRVVIALVLTGVTAVVYLLARLAMF